MAGTGELHVLRRLRVLHGQVSEASDFGSHLATHMALGLLFLGGGAYTLSTSPAATAALLCALYPAIPIHEGDNRAHIQAARHLWVLAVEPRRLIAYDVDSNESIFLPVKLKVREDDGALHSQKLVTPTLIPDLATIESIRIDSPRYLDVRLQLAGNDQHLASFLKTRTLFVKRCGGYLGYDQDAKGVRSLFSRSKTEAGAAVFDFGHTASATSASSANELASLASFATDPTMRAAIEHLCRADDDATSRPFEAFISSIVVEALTQDKALAIALHLALYLAARAPALTDIASSLAQRHLRLAVAFHARGWFGQTIGKVELAGKELVGPALIGHLEAMLRPPPSTAAAVEYFRRGTWPASVEERGRLAYFVAATGTPSVGVLGQLATLAAEAKAAGAPREEVEAMVRLTLEKLGGVDVEEVLVQTAVEAWA
jgi:anaphase-promoting complex subunit 1